MSGAIMIDGSAVYVDPSYLNIMDNVVVKNLVAMKDELTQLNQNLFIGASKDVIIQASEQIIMNLGSSNQLLVNDSSDVASLAVTTDATTTTITAVQKDLMLTTADNSNLSIFIGSIEVSQSNDYQKLNTAMPTGFYFDDAVRTSGNAVVEKSVAVAGNVVCTESLYSRDYNLIKYLTPESPSDAKMIGYSFNINSSNQLELLKHVSFNNGGSATKKVGIFGLNMLTEGQASDSIYTGFDDVLAASNY